MAPVALYDACVLYPAPLRDLLMRLAMTGLFQARWSEQIHEEWIRNLLANRADITRESLERCRNLMDQHVPDSLVVGYESLIPTLSLPDPDDRHVLAAAIHGGAWAIVTFNLDDFPARVLEQYGIEAVDPDEFIVRQFQESPEAVLDAVRRHRGSLKRPAYEPGAYLEMLVRCRLRDTVDLLREHEGEI